MVMNGAVLSLVIIIVYVIALMQYCDGQIFQTDINLLDDYDNKLMDARTVAFISLVWSENVRSYTSRSFDKPVWVNLLGNMQMQKAILMAQLALYAAVLIPYFSDKILKLRGIAVGIEGWLLALIGPIGCVILCEICKLLTAYQKKQYQEELALLHKAGVEHHQPVRKASSHHHIVKAKSMKDNSPVSAEKKADVGGKKTTSKKGLCNCFRFGCV
jgi:magnesium-transporting ATPase (P-type)